MLPLSLINTSVTFTESLNIIKWNDGFISDTNDPIISAIDKYSNHPSIVTIKTREAVTGSLSSEM